MHYRRPSNPRRYGRTPQVLFGRCGPRPAPMRRRTMPRGEALDLSQTSCPLTLQSGVRVQAAQAE